MPRTKTTQETDACTVALRAIDAIQQWIVQKQEGFLCEESRKLFLAGYEQYAALVAAGGGILFPPQIESTPAAREVRKSLDKLCNFDPIRSLALIIEPKERELLREALSPEKRQEILTALKEAKEHIRGHQEKPLSA